MGEVVQLNALQRLTDDELEDRIDSICDNNSSHDLALNSLLIDEVIRRGYGGVEITYDEDGLEGDK